MAAKVVFLALALIVSVGLSTWALAWAYRKAVEVKGETKRAQYDRDEALVEEAEREVRERERERET